MINNFIVPIDFSPDSLKGLEIAVMFSQHRYVDIQMVYVQKKSGDFHASREDEKKFATQKFKELVEEYKPRLGNESEIRYIIKQGKIYAEVVNQAHSYNESIIVTSTHGASGFEEFFIGSNTYKIITATSRPVITIRKGDVPATIKKIVLPVNALPETRQKVPFTVDLARQFGSEIHVVSVCSATDSKTVEKLKMYTNQIKKYIEEREIPFIIENLIGDNISDLTVNYAHDVEADLISIIADKESGLNLFTGSYAHQIINRSNVMVLNLSPKDLRISGSFRTYGG